MFSFNQKKMVLPSKNDALRGRDQAIKISEPHVVLGSSLHAPYPEGTEVVHFGMGCFWGVERLFWKQEGVYTTAVGYAAGYTPNPSYEEVCSGLTGHNEVVRVVFWPEQLSFRQLLKLFWENHNPTQGMAQANDRGTQYRSGIYFDTDEQRQQALESRKTYQARLDRVSGEPITTEIEPVGAFFFAEAYHQQYLLKNPGGYCNLQQITKTGLPSLDIESVDI